MEPLAWMPQDKRRMRALLYVLAQCGLIWKDSLRVPPTKVSLSYIPKGYVVSHGGIASTERKIELKPNSIYSISSTGLGAIECRIKAWTNRHGEIVKTIKLQQPSKTLEE